MKYFVKYTKLFVSSHFIPFNLLIWVKLVYLVTLMKLIIWKNKPSGHKNKRFCQKENSFGIGVRKIAPALLTLV